MHTQREHHAKMKAEIRLMQQKPRVASKPPKARGEARKILPHGRQMKPAHPASTVTVDFQPPESRQSTCVKPPDLWHFLMAALAN